MFVDEGICRVGVRACLAPTVTVAGPSRVLHILVNLRKAQGCGTVAMIGHELQHAIEASEAAALSDVYEFEQYFRSIGVDEDPALLDTYTARQTGRQVAAELRGLAPARAQLVGNAQQLVHVAPGDLLEDLR